MALLFFCIWTALESGPREPWGPIKVYQVPFCRKHWSWQDQTPHLGRNKHQNRERNHETGFSSQGRQASAGRGPARIASWPMGVLSVHGCTVMFPLEDLTQRRAWHGTMPLTPGGHRWVPAVSSLVAWSVPSIVSDRGLLGPGEGRRKRENSMKSQGKPEEAQLHFTALLGHLRDTAREG